MLVFIFSDVTNSCFLLLADVSFSIRLKWFYFFLIVNSPDELNSTSIVSVHFLQDNELSRFQWMLGKEVERKKFPYPFFTEKFFFDIRAWSTKRHFVKNNHLCIYSYVLCQSVAQISKVLFSTLLQIAVERWIFSVMFRVDDGKYQNILLILLTSIIANSPRCFNSKSIAVLLATETRYLVSLK